MKLDKIDISEVLGLPRNLEVSIAPRPKKFVEFDLCVEGENEFEENTRRAYLNVLSFDNFFECEGGTVIVNDMGEAFKVENTIEYILSALND